MNKKDLHIAILGAGNIGTAIAHGLSESGLFTAENMTLTRRRTELLKEFKDQGFTVHSDNPAAVKNSDIILLAVEPHQLDGLLEEIKPDLDPDRHTIISVVSGATIKQITHIISDDVAVVRAMPNTAISIRESMTCISSNSDDQKAITLTQSIFETVGETLIIPEEEMTSATALGACGIAFFLRAIRAASQGGTEIGFHAHDALKIAAQTAKGAASLLTGTDNHPEHEIDRVTTPRGCTIAGLNQMEHAGFSSALIKGIVISAKKAGKLYSEEE